MTKPQPWRFPWGLVVTTALLASVVFAIMRVLPDHRLAPAESVLATMVTSAAVFLGMHLLLGYFWGVVAAAVVLGQVLNGPWLPRPLLAEAAELTTFAVAVASCAAVHDRTWRWRLWLVLAPLACVTSGAAWQAMPTSGLACALLVGLALPASALNAWRRRADPRTPPCPGNVAAGLALGILAPVAGLFLGSLPEVLEGGRAEPLDAPGLLRQAVNPPAAGGGISPFSGDRVQQWCWPTPWAVLPLMVWGAWCSLRRGRKQLARGQAPTAWVLALYSAAVVALGAWPGRETAALAVLSLAALVGLLAVFGVGDVLRNVWDQLRLAPPDERVEEAA
jgi:hypothetical protein